MRAVVRLLGPMVLAITAGLAVPSLEHAMAAPSGNEEAARLVLHADYDEAIKLLIAQGPKDDDGRLLLAEAYLGVGKYAEAADTAKKITSATLTNDAVCLRAEALFTMGKRDDAITALRTLEKVVDARRAHVLLGEYLIGMGKRKDAEAPLTDIIDDYNNKKIKASDAEGLTYVGRAAHLLHSPDDANLAYQQADKAGGKSRVETLLDRAELYLDKYDPGRAGQAIRAAVKIAPGDPRARVALARVKLEDAMDFDAAEAEITKALEVNPNYAPAYFVRAGLALRDLDIEAADKAADEGLKSNPADLELLSMKAAIRFLADDLPGMDSYKTQVFTLNPEFSRFYLIVGEYAEWEHRYDDIIKFMEQATTIDPEDAKAFAELGLNLIRAGQEDKGIDALRTAWKMDEYNVRVFNTLNLYDDSISTDYETVDGTKFRIRYAKSEKAVLERYVPKMLDEAWASMESRYHFTPTTPVSIELYANDEHFSVRTSGLPNVGIQGVCFGHSLALMSPSAGPFNWGNVLWHELGHVFAIQLSKNHVPRWFTEGLSEYETIVRRPEWQREEDPALYLGLKRGKIPAVAAFNRAFTHVDSVQDVTMAYYAASQIIVFIAEKYGFDKVVAMLPLWGKGERTPDVVQHALGISATELDSQYRAWLDARLARYSKQFVFDQHAPPLEDALAALTKGTPTARQEVDVALGLLSAGKGPEAKSALNEALRIDPKFPDANYVIGELAFEDEDYDGADKSFKQMITDGFDGYGIRMKEAVISKEHKDEDAIRSNLEAAAKLDPSQSEPFASLEELDEESGDLPSAMDMLRKYTMLEQHDREAWGKLLDGLVSRGQWTEGAAVGESAIFVDPENPEIHRLYARCLARTGKFMSAIFEYNSAIIAGADATMEVEIYTELIKAYDKLGEAKLKQKAEDYLALAKKHAASEKPGKRPDKSEEPKDKPSRLHNPDTPAGPDKSDDEPSGDHATHGSHTPKPD